MVKGRRDADEMFARIGGTSGYFNIYAMQSGREIFSNASQGVSFTTKVIPFIYSYEILFLRVLVKSSAIAAKEVSVLKVSINLFRAYK